MSPLTALDNNITRLLQTEQAVRYKTEWNDQVSKLFSHISNNIDITGVVPSTSHVNLSLFPGLGPWTSLDQKYSLKSSLSSQDFDNMIQVLENQYYSQCKTYLKPNSAHCLGTMRLLFVGNDSVSKLDGCLSLKTVTNVFNGFDDILHLDNVQHVVIVIRSPYDLMSSSQTWSYAQTSSHNINRSEIGSQTSSPVSLIPEILLTGKHELKFGEYSSLSPHDAVIDFNSPGEDMQESIDVVYGKPKKFISKERKKRQDRSFLSTIGVNNRKGADHDKDFFSFIESCLKWLNITSSTISDSILSENSSPSSALNISLNPSQRKNDETTETYWNKNLTGRCSKEITIVATSWYKGDNMEFKSYDGQFSMKLISLLEARINNDESNPVLTSILHENNILRDRIGDSLPSNVEYELMSPTDTRKVSFIMNEKEIIEQANENALKLLQKGKIDKKDSKLSFRRVLDESEMNKDDIQVEGDWRIVFEDIVTDTKLSKPTVPSLTSKLLQDSLDFENRHKNSDDSLSKHHHNITIMCGPEICLISDKDVRVSIICSGRGYVTCFLYELPMVASYNDAIMILSTERQNLSPLQTQSKLIYARKTLQFHFEKLKAFCTYCIEVCMDKQPITYSKSLQASVSSERLDVDVKKSSDSTAVIESTVDDQSIQEPSGENSLKRSEVTKTSVKAIIESKMPIIVHFRTLSSLNKSKNYSFLFSSISSNTDEIISPISSSNLEKCHDIIKNHNVNKGPVLPLYLCMYDNHQHLNHIKSLNKLKNHVSIGRLYVNNVVNALNHCNKHLVKNLLQNSSSFIPMLASISESITRSPSNIHVSINSKFCLISLLNTSNISFNELIEFINELNIEYNSVQSLVLVFPMPIIPYFHYNVITQQYATTGLIHWYRESMKGLLDAIYDWKLQFQDIEQNHGEYRDCCVVSMADILDVKCVHISRDIDGKIRLRLYLCFYIVR